MHYTPVPAAFRSVGVSLSPEPYRLCMQHTAQQRGKTAVFVPVLKQSQDKCIWETEKR